VRRPVAATVHRAGITATLDWEVSSMTALSTRRSTGTFQLVLALIAALTSLQASASSILAARTVRASRPPPLDLKIGDIRRYVDAATLATPVADELEEIIVQSQLPGVPPERRALPQGLAALAYGVTHPLQAWRICVPDPNYVVALRTDDDAREPPGAYRAKIPAAGPNYW
jgi:hypothetical protein